MDLCTKKAPAQAEIRQDILELLNIQFGASLDKVQSDSDMHFWGLDSSLEPYDMVYLVYMLEDKYGISFLEEDFDDQRFYTLDGLVHIIEQKFSHN